MAKEFKFGKEEGRKRPEFSFALAGRAVLVEGVEVGFVFDKLYGGFRGVFPNSKAFESTTRKAAAELLVKFHREAANVL